MSHNHYTYPPLSIVHWLALLLYT